MVDFLFLLVFFGCGDESSNQDEIVKATTIMNFGKNESVNGIACIKAGLKHLRIIESDKMTNPFETLSNNEKEKMRSLINDLLI